MNDEQYMKRAILLARRGSYAVSPNPMVGAVIVKNGRIIAEGYHHRCGAAHAEVVAIKNATTGRDEAHSSINGADFFLTLEPCCHFGKTPPCTDAILAQMPARVIIGCLDPNPLVAGKGVKILKKAGIKITVGVMEDACRKLNEKFFKFMQTKIPFVTVKFAQSIDGRIATTSGDSRWISSETSRRYAHKLRSANDAILVGRGTIAQDNSRLTTRMFRGRNPLRIVVDSNLAISLDAEILKEQMAAKTIIFTRKDANKEKIKALTAYGVEVIAIAVRNNRLDIRALLAELGRRNVSSLLVEGGAEIITTFLKEKLADKALIFIAPKIVGDGINAVGNLGTDKIASAIALRETTFKQLGGDIVIEATL